MSMKTQRKAKVKPVYKVSAAKKVRSSAPKTTPKSDGKYPLAAYEHLHVGIVETSLTGKYIDANPEFCRILGYSKKELLRLGIKDCTHEDDYGLDIKLHKQLVAGEIPFYGLEKRFVQKEGGIVWVELTRSLIRDEEGKPVCVIGAVIDISDRKQVERSLRESGESLRLATEAARMFKWELDFQKQVYTFADNFVQVLGFSAGLLPQNSVDAVWRLSPAEDVQAITEALTKAIESHCDLNSLQYRMINPDDGQVVWLEANAKVVYDESGNAQRMFGVAQNITEKKRAEEEIQIVSRMPDENPNPAMRLRPDGKILYANHASAPLLAAWTQEAEPRIPDELQQAITDAFTSGVRTEVEIEHRGYFFSCTLAPIPESGYVNLYGKDITERKRAEEKLRESEERFHALVSQATAGIAQSDMNSRLMFVNPRFCEMLGYPESELIGKTIWELTYTDDLEENKRLFEHMRTHGESYQFEKRFIRRDGSILWTSVSVSTILDLVGKPKGSVGVVVDISERKRAEQALAEFARQQEALYHLSDQLHHTRSLEDVYNAALDAILSALQCDRASILLFDDTGVMRFVAWRGLSDRYRKATEGHSPWSADEKNPYPICVGDTRTADLTDSLKAIIQEEGIGSLVFIPLLLNGKLIGKFVVYFNVPHDCMDVEIELGLMIVRQLASGIDQKRAEVELRESGARLRAILSQATAGIVRKDAEGRLIFVNQAFCNMLGYTESELLGKTIWEVTHKEDIEENRRLFEHLMAKAVPFKLEKRLIRQDGSTIWVDVSVSPIMDIEGSPESAVAVEVDITRRKEAEESLQQLNLQLESRVQKRTATIQAMNQSLRDEIAERKRIEEALRQSEETARASEEKLRTLFDLLPVGITFLDPEGKILQVNSAVMNIVKLSKEQLFNETYKSRKYIRADGTPMPLSEFASVRALRENRTIYNVETGIVLENGEVIWTSISAAPVDVAGVGVVVVTVDITDTKHAERALKESHRRLRILSQRLVEVQEEERRALARELHDRVGQTLAALNINLIIINSQLSPEVVQQIGARLNDSMKLVSETIALVRDVMTDLRPAVLDDYGLEAALESQLSKFMSRYNVKAVFERPEQPIPRLGPSVEMTFLRIAQEALMNIARHSHAELVNLSLRQAEDAICLSIQDDGIGIESWQEANRPGSHGLTIMRERADAFGGKLRVSSVPGHGTMVEVSIPFKNGDQEKTQEQHL